ncbi:MAG: hypothetical protein IJU65_07825 [Desulfovibrio sp.]|nr:hypothetical protein [Desulfovibrio sp.]
MTAKTKQTYKVSPLNEALIEAIESSQMTQTEIARGTGIEQASLSRFVSRLKGLSSKNITTLRVFLNDYLPDDMRERSRAIIHRVGIHAPVESITGENLPRIGVFGSTGAGEPVDLFEAVPDFTIEVLPQYNRPKLVALRVEGDSMEPSIHKGAYVGIVPFDGEISDGGVYLIQRPPFGRTIKRIRMGVDGGIVLHSDNAAYPPVNLPFEGYENIVLGKVVWVWQYL